MTALTMSGVPSGFEFIPEEEVDYHPRRSKSAARQKPPIFVRFISSLPTNCPWISEDGRLLALAVYCLRNKLVYPINDFVIYQTCVV